MNDLLLEAMRKQPRRLDCQYVFPGKGGGIYRDLRSALNRAVAEAGITGRVTMYQLRHAFCSHALMQGIDPRTVQKWMGHKDLKTTLRYAHVSPEHERSAIQRLHFRAERSDMTAEAM
jgi:site-specific recombinase XerD